MAVTVTTVWAGASSFIADITATADADVTTGPVLHGLGVVPLDLSICLLQVLAVAAQPCWSFTTVNITTIICMKDGTAAGSGVPGAQARIRVSIPHSIVR